MRGEPLGELRDVSVRYGRFLANQGISLAVAPGEIVALVGENGAGKSTLLHALYGLVPLAGGEVRYGGRPVQPSPERAIAAGIGLVHQHFMLVPPLTVAENVVLGCEPRRHRLLDRVRAEQEVAALAARYGLPVDPRRPVSELTVGEAQRVEILKVLYRGARLLVLDEPTALLTPAEVVALLGVLRPLVADPLAGRGMLLVTHKLDEVMAVADRVVVLRRGQAATIWPRSACDPHEIARAMVGRELALPRRAAPPIAMQGGVAALELRDLSVEFQGARRLERVSLTVHGGEVLGVAGIEGNGQAELCAAVAGLLPVCSGAVLLGGQDVTGWSVAERRAAGLRWVPEDRQRHGLVLDFSLADNLLLGHQHAYRRGPLIDRRRLERAARALLQEYAVCPDDPRALARSLSGGNQQKVVVGRELLSRPRVLLAAQPTRGVDVGAIELIHRRLLLARDGGAAILLVSADLDELRTLSDRIAVLYRGRLQAVLANPPEQPVPRERLGTLMTGGAP